MKKIILFILLLLPMFVYAEECTNEVSIEKIEFVKTEGKATEISEAKIVDQVVKFDIRFGKLNDSVEYKMLIKNNSKEDYQIDKNSIKSESKNVSYILNYGDTSVVEAGKEKEISVIIKYDKQIDKTLFVNNEYELDNEMSFSLVNNKQPNPVTYGGMILIIIVLILAITLCVMSIVRKSKIEMMAGMLVLFIPLFVNALCTMTIKTDSHFVIEKVPTRRCYFDGDVTKGTEFIDGQYLYRYKEKNRPYSGWQDMDEDGWSLNLVNPSSTDPITTEFCAYVNDIPVTAFYYTFLGSKATSIDLSSFNTSNVTDMEGTFRNIAAKNIDLSTFDTHNVKTMWGMFSETDLNGVDLSYLDTSNVENMTYMFSYVNIDTLDLSTFDTSKVKSMRQMFIRSKINNLDLSNFDVSKVENMNWMFREFEGNININGWDTSSLLDASQMFMQAKINVIDLSTFDTSHATNLDGLFESTNTEAIIIPNLSLDGVESVHGLFIGTTAKVIDISGLTISSNKKLTNTFALAKDLETIYGSPDFDYTKLLSPSTTSNFSNNIKLRGGAGTDCSRVEHGDAELSYFRIDGGPSAPGCFTLKQ